MVGRIYKNLMYWIFRIHVYGYVRLQPFDRITRLNLERMEKKPSLLRVVQFTLFFFNKKDLTLLESVWKNLLRRIFAGKVHM